MIPIVFKTYNPEIRSHFFGEQVFIYELIKNFVKEYDGLDDLSGAVIFIRGNDNLNYINQFNEDIAKLKWCLIIVTANENNNGFYKMIKHPNCKIWLQTPVFDDEADFFLPFGWPTEIEYVENKNRKYNWFFAGQVTHNRRLQCVNSLTFIRGGKLIKTRGFGQGLSHAEYLAYMTNSKVVPCPGGALAPDTFRVYEALESGCIPIVDKHSGASFYNGDYWSKVFGFIPFVSLNDWRDLPEVMQQELSNFDLRQKEILSWWHNYKLKVKENFINQLNELSKI